MLCPKINIVNKIRLFFMRHSMRSFDTAVTNGTEFLFCSDSVSHLRALVIIVEDRNIVNYVDRGRHRDWYFRQLILHDNRQ